MISPRRPWAAALLSLPIPGLGHLYAGSARSAIWFGILTAPLGSSLFLVAALAAPSPALFLLIASATIATTWVGVPVHAARRARAAGAAYELGRFNRWYVYLAFIGGVAVWQGAVFNVTKTYVAEAFRMPSASGEPTLLVGDFFYILKFPRAPRDLTDELVVFQSPEQGGLRVVKRTVGLPGDTLSMRDGLLYRNGHQVAEPYAQRYHVTPPLEDRYVSQMRTWQAPHLIHVDAARYSPTTRDWGPLVVSPDSFFAIGDNRDASYDSRFLGFIPLANISGQPRTIYFSYESGVGVRWRRLGHRIP